MPLLKTTISYYNNRYDCGLYSLQYSKLLHGVTDWNYNTYDILSGADNLLRILNIDNPKDILKFRMNFKE